MQSTAGLVPGAAVAAGGARRSRKRRRVAREAGALPFKLNGGARPGAGRKPKGEKAGVPHRRREFVKRCPVHVTVKLLPGMARLRRGREYRALRAAFAAGCERNGFRLVHYAVMNDHLHLIVEADGARAFVRGVQGLLIRVARALNRVWRRRGKVFKDRYHDHVLATPREVRNAIRYVLNNAEHHERQQGGERQAEGIGLDMFTSAPWFEGWLESVRVQGVGRDSTQGDVRFADALVQMGAAITMGDNWIEATAGGEARQRGRLRAVELDCNHIPDAAMTLAMAALFADGTTTLRNIGSWRVKETDRIAAMAKELAKLGAGIEEGADYLKVTPPTQWRPATIDTYDDHRMAMCFSLAALGGVAVRINDPGCVAKTFPDYFPVLVGVTVSPA